MATQTVFSATNVNVPAAPPSYYLPNASGVAVPGGMTAIGVTTVSSLYPSNTVVSFAIDMEYNGTWITDYQDQGYILGPHLFLGATTSTNHFGVTIGALDANGQPMYPTNTRMRVDSVPAGRLDRLDIVAS